MCLWCKKWARFVLEMGMLKFEGLNAFPKEADCTAGMRSAFAWNPGFKCQNLLFTGLGTGYNLYLQIPNVMF